MCFTALAGLAGTVISAGASRSAANSQAAAGERQLEFQRGIYDDTREMMDPYVEAGGRGQDAYMYELGLGDRPEGYEGIPEGPAFKAQLEMGRDTIESGAAGRGNLFSGATATGLERYRSALSSQEVNNYLNRLGALGSQGQSAAAMQGASGQNFAQMGSTSIANIGNAQAAGAMGMGNALTTGLNNMAGAYGYGQGLDSFRTSSDTSGGSLHGVADLMPVWQSIGG